jgi:hypothetical protein
MSVKNRDWKAGLSQLFAATVNQQTLEEAAELMVSVSVQDKSYHEECLWVFDSALGATDPDDAAIISAINRSGYRVSDRKEAYDLIQEFKQIYLHEFHQRHS